MGNKNQSSPTDTVVKSSTGAIAFADGKIFIGEGAGHAGTVIGELCFNTAMTGYQEILTDPSYAEQIVLFTFPHIGNVGANPDDHEESSAPGRESAVGTVFRDPITPPSNWRANDHFDAWLKKRGIVGLSGVDTRAITRHIRENGMPKCAIAYAPDGEIDFEALRAAASAWNGLENQDLAEKVASNETFEHKEPLWNSQKGFDTAVDQPFHAVVIDFGVKKNILRNLAAAGIRTTIVNGDAAFEEIKALNPDGIVLSNGPGDPAATFERSGKLIGEIVESGLPVLGICIGHK